MGCSGFIEHLVRSAARLVVLSILFVCLSLGSPVAPYAEVGAGHLYALIVGVSKYRNPSIKQLNVSDKDARDFARFLEGQKGLFKGVNVKLLTNEQATKA